MNSQKIVLIAFLIVSGAVTLVSSAPVARADQPHMMSALRALQTAESELAAADSDKGGHRAKAIEDTRAAIAEVRAGMAFSNRH